MPSTIRYLRVPKRTPTIGDMDHTVRILKREIQPPGTGLTEAEEKFTLVERVQAMVETKNGVAFFAGVNIGDIPISHAISIRFRKGVNRETWVELRSGSRVRVLNVQNYGERDEFLFLTCTERGPDEVAAARA